MIIANTFPKSGTGLIRQLLQPFGGSEGHLKMFWGPTGERIPTRKTRALMATLRHEEGVMTAHLHWDIQFVNLFCDNKMLFLIRDPRDVIVSHAHYVKNTPMHHLHEYYKDQPIQKCFFQSMMGLPDAVDGYGSYDPFPDVANRFLPYLGWTKMDSVLLVRYEDLISIDNKDMEYRKIAGYLLPDSHKTADEFQVLIDEMWQCVKPSESITFRSGKAGRWQTEFNQVNKILFNSNFSWLLELMGYA